MNALEMCKAIAELEGVGLFGSSLTIRGTFSYCHNDNEEGYNKQYNPITDLALNCMLRDKYEVAIDYNNYDVVIFDANAGEFDSGYIAASSFKEGDIPRAVCLCILKSKGVI